MAPESGVAADVTLVENQTEAVEAAYAAAAPPPVRREPPSSHTCYPQTTASAHRMHALLVDDGPHGRRRPAIRPAAHTRMSVSSFAEAVAPHDSCRPYAAQDRCETSTLPAAPKPEFWLVANIQDCRVTTVQETACAKCFLKIHWQDDDFLTKIRDEKRKLPNTDNFAEQSKDLDLEKLAVDLETGGLVYGMVDVAPDSFPINIDAIFLNQISAERISSLCWTKYDKDAGLVSVSGCAVDPMPCGSIAHLSLRALYLYFDFYTSTGADRGGRHGPRSNGPELVPV